MKDTYFRVELRGKVTEDTATFRVCWIGPYPRAIRPGMQVTLKDDDQTLWTVTKVYGTHDGPPPRQTWDNNI